MTAVPGTICPFCEQLVEEPHGLIAVTQSPAACRVLMLLWKHQEKVVPKRSFRVASSSLSVVMTRLRKDLIMSGLPWRIANIPGIGYKLTKDIANASDPAKCAKTLNSRSGAHNFRR